MNTRSESASNTARRGHLVGAHRALSLYPADDSCLSVLSGRAWVTLNLPHVPQGLGDHVLQAGDILHVPAGAHLVMEPWASGEAVRFDWCVLPVAVQGMTGLTPYARFGDKTALALIGLALIAAVGSGRKTRRR